MLVDIQGKMHDDLSIAGAKILGHYHSGNRCNAFRIVDHYDFNHNESGAIDLVSLTSIMFHLDTLGSDLGTLGECSCRVALFERVMAESSVPKVQPIIDIASLTDGVIRSDTGWMILTFLPCVSCF